MSKERLQEMIYRELDWVPQVEEDNGNLIIRYVNKDTLVISNRTRTVRLVESNHDYLNENKLRELHLLIYKYILREETLRNKKFYLRLNNPAFDRELSYLNYDPEDNNFFTDDKVEKFGYRSQFTESNIEKFKEDIVGFKQLIEPFDKEYVEVD